MQTSWLNYFLDASFVVQLVMLTLIAASIMSWTYILQRRTYYKRVRSLMEDFDKRFWSGSDLTSLYSDMQQQGEQQGIAAIFYAGFKSFIQARQHAGPPSALDMENVQRGMYVAQMREEEKLDKHLPFLASVGSISPYIGLFGTVWGIMTAFHALGHVEQATISMVAPGISEALVATALGLFAAIPAVLAYNRFQSESNRIAQAYLAFQEEFYSILQRQVQESQ